MKPPPALAVLAGLLSLVVLANLWIFARFTVDDAFITWRYGQNLVAHGVWGYNPTDFDLTQAYTNPVFALVSIVPPALGLDVVLVFKLLSVLTLAVLATLLLRQAEDRLRMVFVLALILAIPASVAHAFSGLETWVYGGTLALFFIYAERRMWRAALACVVLLVLTRPEAWLLFGLYPVMLIVGHMLPDSAATRVPRAVVVGHSAVLALIALVYFGFHHWQFGEVLPNTYFIKSGNGLSSGQALQILPYVLPALAILVLGNWRTGAAMTLFFGAVGYSYASSDLLMNYMQRFPFQIVLPVALYLAWAASQRTWPPRVRGWVTVAIVAYLGGFALHTRGLGDHLGISNYYPRLLDSHVALGRGLHDLAQAGRIHAFAMGDAGAPAFHADIPALDTVGLASRMVARDGMTLAVVQAYQPDVVAFIANADGIRDVPERHAGLWAYIAQTGMSEQCEVVWARHYTLRLFTRDALPALTAVCDHSAAVNAPNELVYALEQLRQPPWAFWHE